MNEEIKNVEVEAAAEQKEDSHVTFEILKGKDNEHKFYFSVPKNVSVGIAYDAAFEMLNHITKVIQDMAAKLAPKKEDEKAPESEENKEA